MPDKDIIKYIQNPELINNSVPEQLKHLINKYPFYQAAHFILLKYLKNKKSAEYSDQLIKSSIHISDRDLLFKFLNTEFEVISEKTVVKEEINQTEPETQNDAQDTEEQLKEVDKEKKLLKNQNVKRKINDTIEGMGENISETISSQLEFSVLKKKDKLEYPSEIYFIDEERNGTNNILTIDAMPDEIKKLRKKKDILQIEETDETQDIEIKADREIEQSTLSEDPFELIENDDVYKEENNNESVSGGHFDIKEYDDGSVNQKDDLISRFLEKKPRIRPKEPSGEIEDISQKSVEEDSNLLSETLIKVYIEQGLFEKAIESYRKLSLKYPEKNAYFASRIKILEEKIN